MFHVEHLRRTIAGGLRRSKCSTWNICVAGQPSACAGRNVPRGTSALRNRPVPAKASMFHVEHLSCRRFGITPREMFHVEHLETTRTKGAARQDVPRGTSPWPAGTQRTGSLSTKWEPIACNFPASFLKCSRTKQRRLRGLQSECL